MAWYSTGSITATNNSGSITGVGTSFMTNVRVGDGVTIVGSTSVHEVVNVTSDTQLTITPVYGGTTGSGKTFGIIPVQGYTKDLADQVKSLLLTFSTVGSSASVSALAAITGSANTIPYFTASNTMVAKQANTDAVASTIAVRGPQGNLSAVSLELGYPATTAFTPFIDFHSGSTYVDYDTRIISDTPTGVVGGGRMLYYAGGGHMFTGATGIWDNGYKVYARNNIVGSASQSGGIPQGAIIERGSNANGEYTKFADGTLICTKYGVSTPTIPANAIGVQFALPLAASFINTTYTVDCTGYPMGSWDYYGTQVATSSTTSTAAAWIRNGTTAQQFYVYYSAIGRWY